MPNRRQKTKENNEDTIAAVSTPSGSGGIHVVRVSGLDALTIADTLFKGAAKLDSVASHTAHYGKILDSTNGEVLDNVVALVMREPNSYTCEDTVEFSTHGSSFIATRLVEMLIKEGARLAEPGEFTLRAFLNGRLDLSQAEAVADLIAARTESSHRVAITQLEGRVSERVNTLRDNVIAALTILEAYTDFPEEEIEPEHLGRVEESITSASDDIRDLVSTFDAGRMMKDGLLVPIVGEPNCGKSSLFNCMLSQNRAIVTSSPGTTRDTIAETLNIGGLPVRLVDTAGIRVASDPIESEGVERTRQQMSQADIVITLVDATVPNVGRTLEATCGQVSNDNLLRVVNKIDLIEAGVLEDLRRQLPDDLMFVSAKTGDGAKKLTEAIRHRAMPDGSLLEKADIGIASVRHKTALENADRQLMTALQSLKQGKSHEFVVFDLKLAVGYLEAIIGKVTSDDILNSIFSKFCIGK